MDNEKGILSSTLALMAFTPCRIMLLNKSPQCLWPEVSVAHSLRGNQYKNTNTFIVCLLTRRFLMRVPIERTIGQRKQPH